MKKISWSEVLLLLVSGIWVSEMDFNKLSWLEYVGLGLLVIWLILLIYKLVLLKRK